MIKHSKKKRFSKGFTANSAETRRINNGGRSCRECRNKTRSARTSRIFFLQLTFEPEEEVIELRLSSTGAEEDKRSYKWKRFHINIFNADCYHDSPVSLEVTADDYDKRDGVD